jgi:hypothetical protein
MIWTAPQDKDTGNTAVNPRTRNVGRTRELMLPRLLSEQVELPAN